MMKLFICGDDRYEGEGCGGHTFIVLSDSHEGPPYHHFVALVCATCGEPRREHLVMESAGQAEEKEMPNA